MLKQCVNQLEIIGELKSKTVKRGVTKDGTPTISLDLVICSKVAENKVNEVKVNLWAKQGSKLYAGYETIANEYKTRVDNEVGERLKVSGNIDLNEFINKNDGTLISRPKLKGVFIKRLEASDAIVDSCGAVIECVIIGQQDEIKDGKLTGRKLINLYTVGYNESIIELKDVVVREDLARQFSQIYNINSTGKLFLEINNYAVVKEQEVKPTQTVGFGSTLNVMPDENIVKDYVNEIVIIGGDMPMLVGMGAFTNEEIEEMKRIRNNKLQEILSTPLVPQNSSSTPNGFGDGFNSVDSLPSYDDSDMPF